MGTLTWIKSTENEWLPLDRVNLDPVTTTGVYIIWHGGPTPRTVRVGQGDIKARLTAHRLDPAIGAYRPQGGLWVTWASVSQRELDGVERYLSEQLQPLVGDHFPDAIPIAVNLPWAA
jgi:hypothetical protein